MTTGDISPSELVAWAAGLFEGEGCITSTGGRVTLRVANTDESVIERFWGAIGVGDVYGPYRQDRNLDGARRKPVWHWVASGYDALDALEAMGPWLSARRLDRARELTGLSFPVFPGKDD